MFTVGNVDKLHICVSTNSSHISLSNWMLNWLVNKHACYGTHKDLSSYTIGIHFITFSNSIHLA